MRLAPNPNPSRWEGRHYFAERVRAMEQSTHQTSDPAPSDEQAAALPAIPDFAPYDPYAANGNGAGAAAFAPSDVAAPPSSGYVQSIRPQVSYGALTGELRPLNLGEILDRTFALYRNNFSFFLATLGIAYVPYIILNVVLRTWLLTSVTGDVAFFQTFTPSRRVQSNAELLDSVAHVYASLGIYLLLLAAIGVLLQVASAALIYAANERYQGREVTTAQAYRYMAGRLPALLGWIVLVYLLLGAAMIGMFIVLIGLVAAVIFAPLWFVSLPALVLERLGPNQALARSRSLVGGGYWGMSIGLWILSFLLVWLLEQGIGSVAVVLLDLIPGMNQNAITALSLALDGLLEFVLAPISIVAFTLFYLSLRVRVEAYDIEAAAQAAG